jgi:HSP20 family molecular chaperone IbpA
MPFFPQHIIYPEAAVLQLLSELDQPQQKTCAPRRRQPAQTFTPKFDVVEVENAYELFGELPGLEQKDLEIEFSDAQTLVIKGKTERVAPTPTPAPAPAVQEPQPEAIKEKEVFTDASSEKSHTATVEDDYDEADTPLATPATATTVEAPAQEEKTAPAVAQAPKPKYWVAERKVGEFARSFSFSQRIDHDGVQASLKNGILHVVVPKSQRKGKVVVSVF